uniref:Uncharacterized protein n=1 Tax=Rhizophora mucronata TaxID=61149 RepID=A0A2P2P269_RHIMU
MLRRSLLPGWRSSCGQINGPEPLVGRRVYHGPDVGGISTYWLLGAAQSAIEIDLLEDISRYDQDKGR